MRVLFFVAEYHRFSGSQASLLQLLKDLPAEGVGVCAMFPAEGLCSGQFRDAGIPVEILQAPKSLLQFGSAVLNRSRAGQTVRYGPFILAYSTRIAMWMRKNGVDVLHCNTTRSMILAGMVPRILGYPVVWHVRGLLQATERLNSLAEKIATRIIVVAETLKSAISERARRKVETVYNSVDVDTLFGEVDASSDEDLKAIGPDEFVALTVASVVPFKGLHHLVEAARLIGKDAQIHFLVVGALPDQRYYDYLQYLIKSYELTRFRFLGWKDNLLPFYRRAQVVVLPTVERDLIEWNGNTIQVTCGEGMPRAILEAMAMKKPAVVTDAAGMSEQVLHRKTGLMIPQRNPKAIADAILELRRDPKSAEDMGSQAQMLAREKFGPGQGIKKIKSILDGINNSQAAGVC